MSGVDWAPLWRMLLMGLAVAAGPLCWFWLRQRYQHPAQRLRALTWLAIFMTFDLIVLGAFTRLTDSGLGCPDWPGCYGHASPVGAQAHIAQAEQAMPSGPVTTSKAWIEMLHRYMASGVGVLLITLVLARWREGRRGLVLPRMAWPLAALVLVCLQGAFGALTVTMKLFPAIVTLHLLGALLLLALLAAQAARYRLGSSVGGGQGWVLPGPLFAAVALAAVLLLLQIALGGWVSTNYAVLACQEFPTCQGSWWPEMAFEQGFSLWRELGYLPHGEAISFAGLTAIHYTHRLMAYLVLSVLLALAWRLSRVRAARRPARWLAALTVLQLLTGLSNVVLDWPMAAALAHTAGAAALLGLLCWTLSLAWPDPSHQEAAQARQGLST